MTLCVLRPQILTHTQRLLLWFLSYSTVESWLTVNDFTSDSRTVPVVHHVLHLRVIEATVFFSSVRNFSILSPDLCLIQRWISRYSSHPEQMQCKPFGGRWGGKRKRALSLFINITHLCSKIWSLYSTFLCTALSFHSNKLTGIQWHPWFAPSWLEPQSSWREADLQHYALVCYRLLQEIISDMVV